MKTCTRCKQEKPLTEFHKRSSSKDGHKSLCKSCRSAEFQETYIKKRLPQKYIFLDDCIKIEINSPKCGFFETLIDIEDYEKVSKYIWTITKGNSGFYCQAYLSREHKKVIKLHRFLMGEPQNKTIDHINHNTLDNRKCNLRICETFENNRNKIKRKDSFSIFKGVTYDKKKNLYRARISIHRKRIHLGRFKNETDAAIAYNEAAKKYFGEFALLNEIPND